jgi:pimeloyl-ACP methyl ester carboxylesterase/DNA-binding CsgD family transcriptional regulator
MTLSDRYLDLIEGAYSVSDGVDHFDDLLMGAARYFFTEEQSADLAQDVPRFDGESVRLEAHISRLRELLDESLTQAEHDQSDQFHAQLEINSTSLQVSGNRAAAKLLGRGFPCAADELPFDPTTISILTKMAIGQARDKTRRDQLFLAQVEQPIVQSCLALVHHRPDVNDRIFVSISYLNWSSELLTQLGQAFGLTHGETSVLEGFLKGQTQKEIATARGRSVETIKSQSKTILRKTGCARMADIVKLSAGIGYLVRSHAEVEPQSAKEIWEAPTQNMHILARPNGRSLAYYVYGSGKNKVLFFHGYSQGPFFTPFLLAEFKRLDLQIIAPSRPGFGFSSPHAPRTNYDQVCVDDARAVVDALEIETCVMCAHQGGVSHAFRAAKELEDRTLSMVMIGAGIPIDEKEHMQHMDPQTRILAAASRHAPSVMKLVIQTGLQVYRKRGSEVFLRKYFEKSPIDIQSLKDPDLLAVQKHGVHHIAQQGAKIWVSDGRSAMADWTPDFKSVRCPQYWMHAQNCPVMGAEFVKKFVSAHTDFDVDIVENTGFNILHQAPARAAQILRQAFDA